MGAAGGISEAAKEATEDQPKYRHVGKLLRRYKWMLVAAWHNRRRPRQRQRQRQWLLAEAETETEAKATTVGRQGYPVQRPL